MVFLQTGAATAAADDDATPSAALVVDVLDLLSKHAVERTLKSSPSRLFASLFILLSRSEGVSCIYFILFFYF